MDTPLITVVTSLYNAEDFIVRNIESVRKQTLTNWEHIIVDDCSSDHGVQLVEEQMKLDNRIILLKNEVNSGAAITRNRAIELAKGRYIAFLDSDDQWDDNKLERQLAFMQQNNYPFTYSFYRRIDNEGNPIDVLDDLPLEINHWKLLKRNWVGCLTAMYDTEVFGKVYMENIRKRQDYTLWLKLVKTHGKAYCVPEVLATYTVQKQSISSNKKDLVKYNWYVYREVEKQSILKSLYFLFYNVKTKFLEKIK